MRFSNTKFSRAWIASAVTAAMLPTMAATSFAADITNPDDPVQIHEGKGDWYVSLFAGGKFLTDDVDYSNGLTIVGTDFDSGYTLGGALGYRWTEHQFGGFIPRTEFEFNFSENDVDTINFSGNGPGNEVVAPGSNVSSVGLLANLFLDAPDALGDGITPYFGGGIGLNIIDHSLIYNGPGLNLNDNNDTVFAWHVTAGVDIEINEQVSFFTDVGFHQAVDAGSIRRIGSNPVPAGPGGGFFEDDINSIVVRGGLKISFDGF